MKYSLISSPKNRRFLWILALVSFLLCFLIAGFIPNAIAQYNDPTGVSFKLEGCRDPSVDLEATNFICADGDYTTGNLGKTWNELDLVPHRVTTSAGISAPTAQTYTIAIVADYFDVGALGYDLISVPTINPVSDPSCIIAVGPEMHVLPGLGGIDDSVYRLLTITQDRNTTCVFDYYQRLAVGSHLFPGASLHSNLANQYLGTGGIGSKEVSIPVNDILPQELDKGMTATQDTDFAWNITKGPTPANLDFGDTCDPDTPLDLEVKLLIEWDILPGTPGMVMVITNIYAENPAHRTITVNVEDEIFGNLGAGQVSLDMAFSGDVDVPPNTTQLVLTHTYDAPAHVTGLNDVATATYIDKLTGYPVSKQTTATASAQIQPGTQTNTTVTITDVESISGEGLSYSVDSVAGATGAFQGAYTPGTPTNGDVTWISDTQSDDGYVEFTKTVYLDEPRITRGKMTDLATLVASDGFTDSADAEVDIKADAEVDLTIIKTIPDVLEEGDTASFTFEVYNSDDILVDTVVIDFVYGELSKSATSTGHAPGEYRVEEVSSSPSGWQPLDPQYVYIPLPECEATVTFHNKTSPARAKVKKVTIPSGFENGWKFALYRVTTGGDIFIEEGETNISGTLGFAALLEDGTYKILETQKDGWNPEDGTECIFTVDLPEDAGKWFECTFTNKFKPTITFKKIGDPLSKVGDWIDYILELQNTSPAGGPNLYCTITDELLGIDQSVTLVSGQEYKITPQYKVPDGAPDPLKNNAHVSCVYSGLEYIVAEASSSWEVNLFQPSISFDKTGETLSKVGDDVDYKITLENTSSGDTPDLECHITDPMLGIDKWVTLVSGAEDITPATHKVQPEDEDPLINEACVKCTPKGFPNVLEDCDIHSVNLFQPSLLVTKTGDNYSKVGDTVTYTVKIENISSSDTPNLSLNDFYDSLVPGVMPPAACDDLGPGDSCEFSYDYVVQKEDDSGEPGATLKNKATAEYQVDGFGNKVGNTSDTWSVTLLHPDYTVLKECPDDPIPQEGPAVFTVTFENTGDVDLTVKADEDLIYDASIIPAGTTFTLVTDETRIFKVIIDSPFSGQKTVTNLINSKAALPEWSGLDNILVRYGEDTCKVGGRVNVLKLTDKVVNPDKDWTFNLTGPGLSVTDSTLGDPDGVLDFEYNGFPANLDPDATYTLCEINIPAGWSAIWKIDTNGDGIADKIIPPYNPDFPEDFGSRCFDFGAGTDYPIPQGGTLVFKIDNSFPGGEPRTPGYWKNWNTCTGGNQQYTAAANGGPDEGWFILDDILNDPGISWCDFAILSCEDGVSILDRRDRATDKKKANDAAYNLASHLLAAQLNFAAGAKTCQAAMDAAAEAEALLCSLGFNGTGNYLRSKDPGYHTALDLAEKLDDYNNGILCNPPPKTTKLTTTSTVDTIFTGLFGGIGFSAPGVLGAMSPGIGNGFTMPFSLGAGFSAPFGQGTGFSMPFGLGAGFSAPLGQSAGFVMPFGLGTVFPAPFGQSAGFSAPFGQSAGFAMPFGLGTGFSAPLSQSTGFSQPFGLGAGFNGLFGMNAGFPTPFGLGGAGFFGPFGMSTGFALPF